MSASWYVLHVYSGYEGRIDKNIHSMIGRGELSAEIVRDVKIPTETVTDVKEGKKRTVTKKFFPGYIMVELDLPETDWKTTCNAIRGISGVTGFVGTPHNKRPIPLKNDEAKDILQKAGEIKGEKVIRARQSFNEGEVVKITGGPFESFTGTIEEVNTEKNKLKVMVGIFGRNTPVEVDILQVEKVL